MIYFFGTSESEEDRAQCGIATKILIDLKDLSRKVETLWNLDIVSDDSEFRDLIDEVNSEF